MATGDARLGSWQRDYVGGSLRRGQADIQPAPYAPRQAAHRQNDDRGGKRRPCCLDRGDVAGWGQELGHLLDDDLFKAVERGITPAAADDGRAGLALFGVRVYVA